MIKEENDKLEKELKNILDYNQKYIFNRKQDNDKIDRLEGS